MYGSDGPGKGGEMSKERKFKENIAWIKKVEK